MRNGALVAIAWIALASIAFAQSRPEILIMGGRDHDEFLGCLTCSESSRNSVWNSYSEHGWENNYGTWNSYGPHKSRYSTTSARNEYSTNPPILVDRQGNAYGELTVNRFRQGSVCAPGGPDQICNALRVMCSAD